MPVGKGGHSPDVAAVAVLLAVTFGVLLNPVSCDTSFLGYCKININKQLPVITPLLYHPGSSDILLPQTSDEIKVGLRQQIRLVCPGANNSFNFRKHNTTVQDITPHCVTNNIFSPGNGQILYTHEFGCQKHANATAVLAGNCLDGKFSRIQIGFDLTKGEFAPIIDLCFDPSNYDAVYSAFKLTPSIIGRQHDITRPDFNPSIFYDKINIARLYARKAQRNTLATILSSRKLADKYIRNDNKYFLARGHLTAKADFIYGAEQRSTFFYMNAAPQWQIFNAGNWESLESEVRNFVANRTSELIVVTGTWGTCSLPDENGEPKPLHLYVDENDNRAVKVPGYYWKVLYDPQTLEGAAFVGINNPYLKEVTEEHVFCKDICDNFKWLKWDQFNIQRGYSFCCTMDEFRKTVTTVPDFQVRSVFL